MSNLDQLSLFICVFDVKVPVSKEINDSSGGGVVHEALHET